MKKKLLMVFAAAYALTYAALTAADPDLVKGVDFTGSSSVTAARLNQLVDNAYVGPYRGLVIYTNSAPDVATIPKYARYLWLDSSVMPPTPKVWNTNSGGFWTNVTAIATIADYSVTTSKIATNAVTTVAIADANVTGVKILDGTISGAKIATGTITTTNITDGTITGTDIASGTIASGNIQAAAITASLLAANSVGTSNLQSGFALQGTNIAVGTIASTNIAQAGVAPTNLAASPTALYIPRVNGAATAFEWVNPGLIQMVSTNTGALVTCATAIPIDDTIPQNTEGDQVFSLSITPKSASSKLVITFTAQLTAASWVVGAAALFQDSTADSIAVGAAYLEGSSRVVPLTFRHVMTSGTTSATTFKVRVGGTATVYLNGLTSTRVFGGVSSSSLTIEEIY